MVFLHLQSAISQAFSSEHGSSDPNFCFPAHSSWIHVLLSAVYALQTEPSKEQGTGSKHTEIMRFAVKETKLYWEAFLSFKKNESITHSTLVELKGSNNKRQNLIPMIE